MKGNSDYNSYNLPVCFIIVQWLTGFPRVCRGGGGGGGGGGACDSTASGVGSGPADLDFALRFRGCILNV